MSLSLGSDNDFNFNGDRINGFIPFIIGFLIYSVTISMMSAFFTHQLTSDWSNALNGHMTIEFQSNIVGSEEALTEKQQDEILQIIKSTPGIKRVKKLKENDILKILEPWLNSTSIPDDFPFPAIFDVEADKKIKINLLDLTEKLSKISPEVKIHDHANWYAPIVSVSDGLFFFAILLSVLIFCTVCATVVFITKHTLKSHEDVVQILQLIGANSSYIASQFKQYYFSVGLKSSLLSITLSIITLVKIFFIYQTVSVDSMIKYSLILFAVPIIAIIILMVTSKNSVLYFLSKDEWISK
ncbi:MAG: hypothetical protein IJ730_00850 [Alphaproteobacteria bacterium]|nr:hypothetical protein [Alphaproteobacteria bacterium]